MLVRRKAITLLQVMAVFSLFVSCGFNGAKDKRIETLENRLSSLEKRVAEDAGRIKRVPQQQDLNSIKESINGVKPQLERLEPLLAAFLIKRAPGEGEAMWIARVKQKLTESYGEQLPGAPVASNEVNCTGYSLTVLALKLSKTETTVYLQFNSRADSDVRIDAKETYITDVPTGNRYGTKAFDKTHLTNDKDPIIRLHAGETIVSYLRIRKLDTSAKMFELYWPGCGIIQFVPKAALVAE